MNTDSRAIASWSICISRTRTLGPETLSFPFRKCIPLLKSNKFSQSWGFFVTLYHAPVLVFVVYLSLSPVSLFSEFSWNRSNFSTQSHLNLRTQRTVVWIWVWFPFKDYIALFWKMRGMDFTCINQAWCNNQNYQYRKHVLCLMELTNDLMHLIAN